MNKINVKVLAKQAIIISNGSRLVVRTVDREMSEIMECENRFMFSYDKQPTEIELRIDNDKLKEETSMIIIDEFINHLLINKSIERVVLNLSDMAQYDYLLDKITTKLNTVTHIMFKNTVPQAYNAQKILSMMPYVRVIELMCENSAEEDIASFLNTTGEYSDYYSHIDELILLAGCRRYHNCINAISKLSIASLTIDAFAEEDLNILGNVKSITRLKLKSYEIESFPDTIGRMKNLKFLDISETQISKDTYKLCIEINEKYGIPEVMVPMMQIK